MADFEKLIKTVFSSIGKNSFPGKSITKAIIAIFSALGLLFSYAESIITNNFYTDYKAPSPALSTYTKEDDDEMINGDFYVSTNGSDTNNGTKDAPFLTIEKAMEAVRNTDKTGKSGITVCIEGGEYRISSLEFTKEDSGTAYCPITYRAYNGKVVINGGKNLESSIFSSVTDEAALAKLPDGAEKNIICTDLTKLGLTADDWGKLYPVGKYGTQFKYDGDTEGPVPCNLYFNGNPLTTARYPNEGFLNTVEIIREGEGEESAANMHVKREGWEELRNPETTIFTVDPATADRLNSYSSLDNVWLWTALIYEWADTTVPIKSFDYATKALEPAYVSRFGAVPGSTYYIFNAIEELDAAGEWYLDRESGMLYLYPPEDINNAEITFSLSDKNIITVTDAEYICFDGLSFRGTRSNGIVIKSNYVTVKNCLISELSGNGVAVDGYHNLITDCEFTHIGATAVELRGGDRETLTAGENRVENCIIHDVSEVSITEGQGVNIGGVGNICAHNEIYNTPQQAIWFGGNSNIIEYNNIHDVVLLSSDSSAIYTGRRWDEVGTIVRYNAIYNVGVEGFYPHGIYFDDGASGHTVYGNIIANCNGNAFMLGGGRNLNIYNNIIINCDKAFFYDARSRNGAMDPDYWFEHSREGLDMYTHLLESPWQSEAWQTAYPYMADWSLNYSDPNNPDFIPNPADSKINSNIIIYNKLNLGDIDKKVKKYSDISGNPIYALYKMDSIFADYQNGNYNLREDSKVFNKIPDFENIPLEKIGRIAK